MAWWQGLPLPCAVVAGGVSAAGSSSHPTLGLEPYVGKHGVDVTW